MEEGQAWNKSCLAGQHQWRQSVTRCLSSSDLSTVFLRSGGWFSHCKMGRQPVGHPASLRAIPEVVSCGAHVLFAKECSVVFEMRRPLCSLHRKVLPEALSVSPGKNRSHSHYSGPTLHNQQSGRPIGPGALPTGRSLLLRATKHPSAQNTPQPNFSCGWALDWGRSSIGQRNLVALGAEPSLGRFPVALLELSLVSSLCASVGCLG